jgi:2-keto-3-deoxy-L-rhamnonate aldolase RhmA
MSFENKLRQLLDKDQPTVGTHLGIASPIVTELVGLSGQFDYVEFAGEYYPYTDFDLANLARTAEMYGMSTMIKIDQSPRIYIAERAMGIAGIQNLLFADLRTIEDVQLCVDAVRCDPKGIGGARFGRVMTKLGSLPAWVKYCDDAVVAIMVEKKIAVEHLEELLSVEGVDMVQWGPADFTVSSGIPGQYTNPKVKDAELKVIKTALKMDIRPRIECSVEAMQKYIDLGCRDFCIGMDTSILSRWFKDSGKTIRDTLAKI